MAQVISDFIEGMKKQSYDYFYETHDQHASIHPLIFKPKKLDSAWEQWTSIVEEEKLEVKTSESQDAPVSDTQEGFTIYMKARTFHRRKVWSKETTRDMQGLDDLVKEAINQWGNGVFINKEEFYSDFFNSGGFTAGVDATFDNSLGANNTDPSGDGVYDGTAASVIPFFNLSGNLRTSKGGATYSNSIVGALNEGNLEQALILLELTNAFSERDQKMRQMANTLLVPVNLERIARKLIESSGGIQEAHSGVINPYQNRFKVLVWNFITGVDDWYVGVAKRGVVMGMRQEPEIVVFEDQRNRNIEAVIDVRFGGTVEDFRPWVASNLSTS